MVSKLSKYHHTILSKYPEIGSSHTQNHNSMPGFKQYFDGVVVVHSVRVTFAVFSSKYHHSLAAAAAAVRIVLHHDAHLFTQHTHMHVSVLGQEGLGWGVHIIFQQICNSYSSIWQIRSGAMRTRKGGGGGDGGCADNICQTHIFE